MGNLEPLYAHDQVEVKKLIFPALGSDKNMIRFELHCQYYQQLDYWGLPWLPAYQKWTQSVTKCDLGFVELWTN